jgi:DNA polymerase-1
MGAMGLANRINTSKPTAERLLRLHRETYPDFWRWSDAVVDRAMSVGEIETVFGWKLKITRKLQKEINTRSIRNFPMQANGAEMMRIATILATRSGVQICAPVHDAFLIEAPEDDINSHIWAMQDAMACASREVLGGVELRSDVNVIWSGERYEDPRGANVWKRISDLVSKDQLSGGPTDMVRPQPPHQSTLSLSRGE